MATLTFLFTDIENSSHLWEVYPEAMKPALQQHDRMLRQVCQANDALFMKSTGDGMMAVFTSAEPAALAAQQIQRSLAHA